MLYQPEAFAALDLDRHRLALDDADFERLLGWQKAIADGTGDPAFARHLWARLGVDRALQERGIDPESPDAADVRAGMRDLLDGFEAVEGRPATGADIDAIVTRVAGGAAEAAIVQEASEPFDPRHVVPASPPRQPPGRPSAPQPGSQPPSRPGTAPGPAPGPGHNLPRPEMPPGVHNVPENWRRWWQSSPPASGPVPPPDTAGPGAAAAGDNEAQRRRALEEARESLKALAPDHEFLKEPPDTVADQATVDRYGKEVTRIVREKVDAKTSELQSKSSYDHRSGVRTISGDVDLRAEFEKLKVAGKRIYPRSGQYSEGQGGEMYELPGGIRVGFRMANDMRTGVKNSIPTMDVDISGGDTTRFHHNPGR